MWEARRPALAVPGGKGFRTSCDFNSLADGRGFGGTCQGDRVRLGARSKDRGDIVEAEEARVEVPCGVSLRYRGLVPCSTEELGQGFPISEIILPGNLLAHPPAGKWNVPAGLEKGGNDFIQFPAHFLLRVQPEET